MYPDNPAGIEKKGYERRPIAAAEQEWRKKRIFLLAVMVLLPLLTSLLLASLVLEREPLLVETSFPTVETALRARSLAKEVLACLDGRRETATLSATEGELNALLTLAGRGVRRFSGRARVTPGVMTLHASIRLPANPLGRYLNLQGELLPDERGLHIQRVKLGKLRLPRPLAVAILRGVIDLGLGNREGSALLGSVSSVEMSGDRVTFNLRSLPQLKQRLQRLQIFLVRMKEISRGGAHWDREAVGGYYVRLLEVSRRIPEDAAPSLAAYLGPLFRLARERSVDGDPVQENRAALLALAIYLGDPRFEKLAGPVLRPQLSGRSSSGRPVHLGGRQDLRLHFVISAGLKLISDQGISSAIGEFKELLDAGRGGSGFSFIDLAADRAGIRLAETAVDGDGGAARLQELLAAASGEQAFFPVVADLPENMPSDEFELRFGGVGKPGYNGMLREIERRIDRCPAYKK